MNGAGPGDNVSPEAQDKRHGAIEATLGYAGMYYHARSGLYLTHFRAYDPRLGRWLSRDPIWEAGGVNLYGYVGGDPIGWVDSEGLTRQHTTNQRESNRERHEQGQSRSQQDSGGEKGDKNRDFPRRRPNGWKGPWPPRIPGRLPGIPLLICPLCPYIYPEQLPESPPSC